MQFGGGGCRLEGWRIQFWKGDECSLEGGRCGLKGGECSLKGGRYGLGRAAHMCAA